MRCLELPPHADGHPCLQSARGDPNPRYPVADFLDDQRRVAAAGRHRDLEPGDTLQGDDGRLRIVHATLLHHALDVSEVPRAFARKYPGTDGADRLRRFALVVDFLETCGGEIVRDGVGEQIRDSIAVRDELLGFLLEYPVARNAGELPHRALDRFMDEWGHRWL